MELKAEGVSRRYMRKTGEANYFDAVREISLTLEGGRIIGLTGRSGSGKTTLLHMMAGLLRPTEGRVLLDGADLYAMEDRALSRLRSRCFGVIPQGRSAVDSLTVLENILLPGALSGRGNASDAAREKAGALMAELGIEALADAWPGELSGGELRRMAIARALTHGPDFILADEPTGDLDDENTARVLMLLRRAAEEGAGVLLVTHESGALTIADEVWRMDAGSVKPAQ